MFYFEPCPFCGGYIRIISRIEHINSITTEAICARCHMNFKYEQNFSYSKNDRAAINYSFEEIWNNRVNNT